MLAMISRVLLPLIGVTSVIALMWPTAQSIITLWLTSDTFSHGFFILPVFLWLVWRKRAELGLLKVQPDWRPTPLIFCFGAGWFLSRLIGLEVGEQLAMVLIIMCVIWATVGSQIAHVIRFPILFLFFLAPLGQELVPALMDITADFTVWAIRLSGIPIYREGLFFSLPSGDWSVVRACSGVNYLIASITLGTVYAHLNYTSNLRKLVFIAFSAIVPIFANGIRAYLIVMIGHLSSNKLAVGVDHLIYGWVFFGLVMFVLFGIGGLFHDSQQPATKQPALKHNGGEKYSSGINRQHASVLFISILLVAIWPAWASQTGPSSVTPTMESISEYSILPDSIATTATLPTANFNQWEPIVKGFDFRLNAIYEAGTDTAVKASAYLYINQTQGKEMISSSNVLVKNRDNTWRVTSSENQKIVTNNGVPVPIQETTLHSSAKNIVIWKWYAVGNQYSANPLQVKMLELLYKAQFKPTLSTIYIIYTDETPSSRDALASTLKKIIEHRLTH